MHIIQADIAIVGAGGAGLRAAIAAAESHPNLKIALISKVYPMRSHTVAAEGGSAAVTQSHDSFDAHFTDTVAGGDWLCEQDVVDYFVRHCPQQMIQLEQWGCPWSRCDDGSISVRRFGGMQIERTWYAADKTGFHILHTLFQTSLKYPQITRFDEHVVLDLLVDDGQAGGLLMLDMLEGSLIQLQAPSVILATGGAGRVYRYNTNGGIVTGDGMGIALRHGVPLRDMEFVQYHPTGLPGSGILMTEGCRGEGGILVNRHGYRYLQDYGLGPETPPGQPKNKFMELGPRDKVSQAFWHEWQKGNTIATPRGDVVYLDLRHLGASKLHTRLPFICELSKAYMGIDPLTAPIPVRPTAHYTMGGIETNGRCETRLKGLYAVGECASIGLHGANRLGSNSLAELVVFGQLAGEQAAIHASSGIAMNKSALQAQAQDGEKRLNRLIHQQGDERWSTLRDEMGLSMESGCGIYRTAAGMHQALETLEQLRQRFGQIRISDSSSVFNTELLYTLELEHSLNIARCMVEAALARRESRGAHQRLDEGCTLRDDRHFLKHSLTTLAANGSVAVGWSDVRITTLPPAQRLYGAQAEAAAQKETL